MKRLFMLLVVAALLSSCGDDRPQACYRAMDLEGRDINILYLDPHYLAGDTIYIGSGVNLTHYVLIAKCDSL